jgi:hypothetical protein
LGVNSILTIFNTILTPIQSIVAPFAPGINVSVQVGATVLRSSIKLCPAYIRIDLCARLRVTLGTRSIGTSRSPKINIGLSTGLGAAGIGTPLRTGLRAATSLLGNRPTRHGKRQDAYA